jgi:hypothetical protein
LCDDILVSLELKLEFGSTVKKQFTDEQLEVKSQSRTELRVGSKSRRFHDCRSSQTSSTQPQHLHVG